MPLGIEVRRRACCRSCAASAAAERHICDDLAAGSPYPLDDCPVPVESSHSFCLCYLTANVRPLAEVNAELRAMMRAGENPPYSNPANYSGFIELLLGAVLAGLARRMMNALA